MKPWMHSAWRKKNKRRNYLHVHFFCIQCQSFQQITCAVIYTGINITKKIRAMSTHTTHTTTTTVSRIFIFGIYLNDTLKTQCFCSAIFFFLSPHSCLLERSYCVQLVHISFQKPCHLFIILKFAFHKSKESVNEWTGLNKSESEIIICINTKWKILSIFACKVWMWYELWCLNCILDLKFRRHFFLEINNKQSSYTEKKISYMP